MIFVLIIGLTLLGAAVFMIVRAAYGPRASSGTTSATLQQIGAYGFSGAVDYSKLNTLVSETRRYDWNRSFVSARVPQSL